MKKIFQKLGAGFDKSSVSNGQPSVQERYAQLRPLHKKYRTFTMIPAEVFVNNLLLIKEKEHLVGDFVECGVWRGGMCAAAAEMLGDERSYYLFDSFEGLPEAKDIDGEAAKNWQADTDSPYYFENCAAEESHAREAMELAGAKRFHLKKGWFEDTLPRSAQEIEKIAILRLDGDWYDSTMQCLQHLYPRVVEGGIIIVDDYHTWDGCTKAVHDYLSSKSLSDRICQFNNSVCYILKGQATYEKHAV